MTVADDKAAGSSQSAVDRDHPWPGLEAFRERDAPFFHGRRTEIEELLGRVQLNRLTVLFGVAGLGKTSLLRAGLSPALRPRCLPVYLRVDFESTGGSPFADRVLATVSAAALAAEPSIEAPQPCPGDTLWEYFHREESGFWDSNDRLVTPVLIFDQLEEVFTVGRSTPDRRRAADAMLIELADMVEGRPPLAIRSRLERARDEVARFAYTRHNFRVVLSLREDYLPELEEWRAAMPSIIHNRMRLLRFDGRAAFTAIREAGGHLMDETVAEKVIRLVGKSEQDLNAEPELAELQVDPAILSVFCRELNNRRLAPPRKETISEGLLTGNREEILVDFYERSLEAVPAEKRLRVRLFIEDQLLTQAGYRTSLTQADATAAGVDVEVLEDLVDRRLLRIADRPGLKRYELAHDVLTEVVSASRDRRQAAEALREAQRQQRATARTLRRSMLFAGVLLTVTTVAAVLGILALDSERRRATAELTAFRARAGEVQQQRRAQEALATSDLKEASTLLKSGRDPEALAYLARAVSSSSERTTARSNLLQELLYRGWHLSRLAVRHAQAVRTAHLSRRGDLLLTSSADGTARVWEAATGKPVGPAILHRTAVTDAKFGPGGKVIVTLAGRSARIWETGTARLLVGPLEHDGLILGARFSPDGQRLVTASKDGSARIWEVHTGRMLQKLELPRKHGTQGANVVSSAQFSPDEGGRVLTSSWNQTAQIWDASTGKPLGPPILHDGWVWTAEFSPIDGKRIVTGSGKNTAQVWDAKTGKAIGQPLLHHGEVRAVHFSPDGSRVVTASLDNTARIWDASTGRALTPPLQHHGKVWEASFSSDGRLVATASSDGEARLWDAGTGQLVGETMHHSGRVTWVEFSSDGRRLATASDDGTARLWDVRSRIAAGEPLAAAGDQVKAGFLNADGRQMTTVAADGTIDVLDVATDRLISASSSGLNKVDRVEVADGMRHLALVGERGGRHLVRVVTAATGVAHGLPIPFEGAVQMVALSRGGGHVVTVQGGVATLWDTASGRRVGPGPNLSGVVRTVRFAPDGHLLLTAGTGGVAHLWDPASGRHQGDLADGEEWSLNCVEPSPNDRRVVICSQGGYAQVFDAASRQPLGEPMRTEVAVTQAEWSADNERVLTISSDCTVQVWDAASGAAVSERIYPGFPCRRAHFSPDGQRVVTGSAPEGKVLIRLWEAGSGSQIGHDLSFQGNLTDLTFSPDGQRLLLIQEQARPSLWDMATGKSGDAELLTLMAEVAGGNEVNEQGHVLAVTELSGRWDRLLHGITGQGVGAAVAKWLVADPRSEMVSPLSSPRPKGSTPVPGATATATSNR